ncbi:uncharacterized protein HMPREF1541_00977 [Cyphellophora europaea CBS 101466]|uniref:EKC/KEOPS complex subunit CGI121 n=1 Tax=Cyphellophora europaea (strain CBS 101466) TaxID=1220924 RepID=W2SFG9_CYPE1|nr:uncharacterized protein HMPREF1541_00977 [Cyphellophora europaea CBS 101466]ETN46788.1 hypothetical protein HMPREF1541_00977 [Cyphellophora europaea CBS 101466]
MVEQVSLAHIPPELAVYVALYTELENAAFLRDQLLAGNTDFEYAFIDASMVVSRNQVLAATFRALNDYLHDRLKSRNVHSEIVFSLSPNNNIGEAFRRFGISADTKDLIVVKVTTTPDVNLETIQAHLSTAVKAQEVQLVDDSLAECSDLARIRRVYKLPVPASNKPANGVQPSRSDRNQLEAQILGVMALRGAT